MSMDPSILHPTVRQTLDAVSAVYETLACDEALADTAEFCAAYGIPPDEACNTILVALKKSPREYVACLVRADTRLDVNHRVAAAVGFKRLSFASAEETAELTGMMIGGVTLVGLPPAMPILIDEAVFEKRSIIVGGGNRSSKVRIAPAELLKLAGARRAVIAASRGSG
jgi:prolyl-tRNA editing enzyme YbaK/EbsC (Cys-tRNA(Pro) deacylase)